MGRRLSQTRKGITGQGECSSYMADLFGYSVRSIGTDGNQRETYVNFQPIGAFYVNHTSCVECHPSILRAQCGYELQSSFFRATRGVDHDGDREMRHLFISAPIVALVLSVLLFQLGVDWRWVACTFFLTAPALIGLAILLCNTVLPCSGRNSKD